MIISLDSWGFEWWKPLRSLAELIAQKYICTHLETRDESIKVICDLTWTFTENVPQHLDQLKEIIDLHADKEMHIVFHNLFDDSSETQLKIIQAVQQLAPHAEKHYLGSISMSEKAQLMNSDPTFTVHNFPGMSVIYRFLGKHYNKESLIPLNDKFHNRYLCYFGKPHDHRVDFYHKIQHQLDSTITFFEGYTKPLADNLLETAADFGGPEGSFGLGNMHYWRSSFLNIVLETQCSRNNPECLPFFSEKTFKPMIGMRPFLLLGDQNSNQWLLENNFRVYNAYFGYENSRDLTSDQLADIVNNLTLQDVNLLWKHMQKDIQHNYNRYYEYSDALMEKLNIDNFVIPAKIY